MMAEGVTVAVVRTVRVGTEADVEAWMHGVSAVALTMPGHLGITIFRPPPSSRSYTFVFRFDTPEHLAAWEQSPERAEWAERAEAFTERVEFHKHTGLETWFPAPGGASPPPRWKMAVVGWAVAFPLVQLLNATLGRGLAGAPSLVRGALVGAAMVIAMTYVMMPWVTARLRRWLFS